MRLTDFKPYVKIATLQRLKRSGMEEKFKKRDKFVSRINIDGVTQPLGIFDTLEEAKRVYDKASAENHFK